jgi:N-methylhydantoinase B
VVTTKPDESTPSRLDPVTLSLLLNRFSGIATEMTVALSNAAFSALLSLTNDFSCAIFDARGRQLTAVDAIPIHTNSMHLFLEEIERTFGDDIHEGDVIACNHPYRGNTHIGDLVVVTPVYVRGRHVLWAAVKAHQLDVGAPVPTSANPHAETIWEEGIMIPPVKLYDRGVARRDVIDFYLSNVRWRELLEGDLMAQLGAVWTGERRLRELCETFSDEELELYLDEAIAYSRRRMVAELAAMPKGRFVSEAWFDSDGRGLENIPIKCSVTISDEGFAIDFTGSAPQVRASVNASYAVLQAAGGIPVMMSIEPDIPHNQGCLSFITVTAPEGTICNATYPAATALATVHPADVMQDAVYKALAQAIPERVRAGSSHWANIPMFSGKDPRTGKGWGHQPLNSGGGGGGALGVDGWPLMTTNAAYGGLRAASIEHTELLHPLRFEECEIEPESMGFGEYIGGPGVRCTYRPVGAPVALVYMSDGLLNPPHGVLGGLPGAGGGAYVTNARDGSRRLLPAAVNMELSEWETWTGVSSGGGGYGDPLDRDAEQVRIDVLHGLYPAATGAAVFGVQLDAADRLRLDRSATDRTRASMRAARGNTRPSLIQPTMPGASVWQRRFVEEGGLPVDRGMGGLR